MADVIISGLADESSASKRAEEQLAVTRALGLTCYSPRFVDVGEGVKNVMQLTPGEVERLCHLHREFGVTVSSLASPLGKVKLVDVDDGTANRYVPFDRYLREDVARAVELAQAFGARLIRGFSFYPPKGDDPREHLSQAAEQIHAMAEACAAAGLLLGLEVEANLVGRNGELEAELWSRAAHPNLGLVFDGGNLVCQGYDAEEVFQQYLAMKPGLLWIHVKDYLDPELQSGGASDRILGHVAEDALEHFVPCDRGHSGYARVFEDVKQSLPALRQRLEGMGLPGLYLDLEPHLKGGGQFGGFSGPDGYGVAQRALLGVLDRCGLTYDLTTFDGLKG